MSMKAGIFGKKFLLNQVEKQVKLKLQIICNMYKSIKTTLVAFIAKFA